jgi:diaminopimelate epimerase
VGHCIYPIITSRRLQLKLKSKSSRFRLRLSWRKIQRLLIQSLTMAMYKLAFTKMQALGNDFVVIDATRQEFRLTAAMIARMADRKLGIGFDQLLIVSPASQPDCDFNYRIFNADGSEVGQCGNGARALARFIQANGLSDKTELKLLTLSSQLEVKLRGEQVTVVLPPPKWLPSTQGALAAVDLGNPHLVFLVADVEQIDLVAAAQPYLYSPAFPDGVNVGFMAVINSDQLRLRVNERGVGPTMACGSGACAAAVAAQQQGLVAAKVKVIQPGGSVWVEWQGGDAPVNLTGSAEFVFSGEYYVN